ncbi:MAG: SRPBCC family protein [Chloroflexi bacterium]|nr:SRPBCC family protein [Chloroflexota bacterium]MDA1229000.1 SRPBCC family protein [Chloroflexota bacterium]
MAETKLELSIFIKRPIAEVFEFVSKAENMPKWAAKIVDAAQTSEGPIEVGTTCYVTAKAMGREATQDFIVTECVEDKTYVAKSTSGPVQMETRYDLDPAEEGTNVRATVLANMGGMMAVAGPFLARKMKKQFEEDHANLKLLLES